MKIIRRPLAGLLALFVGALAIDRLALASADERAIDTPSYLIALGFVIAPLLVAGMRRVRVVTLAASASGAGLAVHVSAGTLSSDPYQTLVETAFIALAAGLAHNLANRLDDLDKAISSVVFGDSPALPLDGRQAANEILGEMARSRRHSRPLSVTVLAPDPSTLEVAVEAAAEEVQRAVRARYVQAKIAHTIADQLRRSDLLFEDAATGHFVVVSPETSSDGATLLVERIRRAVLPTNVRLESGRATFPDNALTFEQLVEHAQEHMDDPPADGPGLAPASKGAA